MVKIAICSDIHDHLSILDAALNDMRDLGAEVLFFCGDFNAPFTLKALAEGFPGPVHVVWGNNDGDQWLMTEVAHGLDNVTLHGVFAEVEIEGYRVAAVHYPRLGWALAHADLYDLVCYGHDHEAHQERVGETLLLNPGELMGRFGVSTYAMVDSGRDQAEIREVFPG
ncbi:MAG: metallophosphoesterase [Anaerolineae bacterium]